MVPFVIARAPPKKAMSIRWQAWAITLLYECVVRVLRPLAFVHLLPGRRAVYSGRRVRR